ncbi:MAG: glycoside hydrolase/phage tail family protein [Devosia sp.]|nr:glycoside hydrolase/phage tail family protein [Devosia sp.]
MATLALSVAGGALGGVLGGPLGATVGRALGALAGNAIDNAIFGDKSSTSAATGSDISLQGSTEGGSIPRLYGWNRVTGNIIWATQLEETTQQSSGAKGTSSSDSTTTILANFAVALCEGEVSRLGRIWADGEVLETAALNLRFYRGSEDQLPDSLIEAKQGAGNAPAYRGLCYLVFEQLDLTSFGNRIPILSVELCRVVGELEPAIRAITVIPGATEFGYDPTPRVRVVSHGTTANENAHLFSDVSDWSWSIDELTALCPNLEHVSLVVAWFGDDLRCDACTLAPRVESATKTVNGTSWAVSGLARGAARVVSRVDGGPAYGGTPSDAAVLAAIADLKARRLKVMLYPMVLMDIAAGNTLIDPYSGAAGQPAYPWRGRITCSPAPGQAGTPDQTAALSTALGAFLGSAAAGDFTAAGTAVNYAGPAEWSYRRMLLHYAKLAGLAGGVDAFIVGSELRGLTTLRGAGNSFPFVDALATLAADIRAIVGGTTRLTYAADWSEFSGYQPADAPGDKFFHLDVLWACSAIDALGLDNYLPLADWRDGTDHLDAATADGPYDPAYLSANIAGGEAFDWYYASDADRIANVRTPIADSLYGEPWVWRCKDLIAWWSNAHHNRSGGMRSVSATAWVPQSKPLWLTELGCPAVDKGANQPNVFPDPKSSEDAPPYFSSGAPDALAQRQFLRAHLGWWRPAAAGFIDAHNPVSTVYGARMLDPDRIYLWTWDARPFPAFPLDSDVWADGPNYATGHWLSGRLGALASDELVRAVAADYGLAVGSADAAQPLVFGTDIEGVVSARDALQPLLSASTLAVRDTSDGLAFALPRPRLTLAVEAGELVDAGTSLSSRKRPDPSEAVGRVALSYTDRERDYLTGTVTAMRLAGGATSGQTSSLVLDLANARGAAERLLAADSSTLDTLEVTLPRSLDALEVGDPIALGGQGDGPFVVTALRDGVARTASLQAIVPTSNAAIVADRPLPAGGGATPQALPLVVGVHLPADPAAFGASRLLLGAMASPWPGTIEVTNDADAMAVATLTRNAALGELASPLDAGPVALWDDATSLTVALYSGHLSSASELAVLGGANRLAIETDSGEWEIIGFANATLTAPSTYRLTHLLRGQAGTVHAVGPAATGNRLMVLDNAMVGAVVSPDWLGETLTLRAYAGRTDPTGTTFAAGIDLSPDLPLAPVHLGACRDAVTGDIALSWVRCSRSDTDSWTLSEAPLDFSPEAYTLTIFNGITPVRTIAATAPASTYSGSQQTADFGGLPTSFTFTVAQLSPSLGAGLTAQGAFNA